MVPDAPDRRSGAFTAASVPYAYERRLVPVVFEPWAVTLLDAVGLKLGDGVLDVASGTGVVARLAAERVGPTGRVVASDVSPAMLEFGATRPSPSKRAPIEFVAASATELPFPDGGFDAVVCQQGLQFFPDRAAAVGEMGRVVRAGGVVGVAVWAAGSRLEPFEEYTEALAAAGVEPPFPHAFDSASFVIADDELRELFERAGFDTVEVSVVEQSVEWPDAEWAAAGILGTPFGPSVEALAPDRRRQLESDLARRFAAGGSGGPIRRSSTAAIVRAVARG